MIVVTCIFSPTSEAEEVLQVCLFSARKHGASQTYVFYSDLTPDFINDLKKQGHTPIRVSYTSNGNMELASQKLFFWHYATHESQLKDKQILFVDGDTLVIEDSSEVFSKPFDFAYTAKEDIRDRFPLNTGVLFLRNNASGQLFMAKWFQETQKVLSNPELLEYGTALFGGADQMSLARILKKTSDFLGPHGAPPFRTLGLSSNIYNLHKYWNDPSRAKIIHYKSGWSSVLVQPTTDFRGALRSSAWKRKDLWEIAGPWKPSFDIWKKYQQEYHGR